MLVSLLIAKVKKLFWNKFQANAWLKNDCTSSLEHIKIIGRTENQQYVIIEDYYGNTKFVSIEKILLPLDKKITIEAVRSWTFVKD